MPTGCMHSSYKLRIINDIFRAYKNSGGHQLVRQLYICIVIKKLYINMLFK